MTYKELDRSFEDLYQDCIKNLGEPDKALLYLQKMRSKYNADRRVPALLKYWTAPEVVTLCGSSRFKADFLREQARLTNEGKIFLTLGFFGHIDAPELMDTEIKERWDELHKRKIDISDSIFVINKDGYIGESTRSEIDYATSRGKIVRYMEPIEAEEAAE